MARGCQDQGPLLQKAQGIGDVPRSPSEFFRKIVDQKTDIQNMQLLGEDMVRKAVRKAHDPIIGQGAGNIDIHGKKSLFNLK